MTQNWQTVSPEALWTEPDDGGKTVLGAITSATSSVDISIYEIGGPKILAALETAKANGADLRIMVNGQFFAGDDPNDGRYDQAYAMMDALDAAPGSGSVDFHFSSNNFNITHQKTILIDTRRQGQLLAAGDLPSTARALVMTLNLSAYAWKMSEEGGQCTAPCQFWGPGYPDNGKGTRDFGAVLTDPESVARIAAIFDSDFSCPGSTTTHDLGTSNDGLIWSNGTTGLTPAPAGQYPADGAYPYYNAATLGDSVDQGNARAAHEAVIEAAQSTLVIYNEEMDDDQLVAKIAAAATRGVAVRVIMTGTVKQGSQGSYYNYYWNYDILAKAGAQIRLFPNGADFMYIHAKVLLADAGTDSAFAFVGSQNISGNSLNFNRELGVLVKGQDDTQLMIETFETDWQTPGLIVWPDDGSPVFPPSETSPSTDSKYKVNPENGPLMGDKAFDYHHRRKHDWRSRDDEPERYDRDRYDRDRYDRDRYDRDRYDDDRSDDDRSDDDRGHREARDASSKDSTSKEKDSKKGRSSTTSTTTSEKPMPCGPLPPRSQ